MRLRHGNEHLGDIDCHGRGLFLKRNRDRCLAVTVLQVLVAGESQFLYVKFSRIGSVKVSSYDHARSIKVRIRNIAHFFRVLGHLDVIQRDIFDFQSHFSGDDFVIVNIIGRKHPAVFRRGGGKDLPLFPSNAERTCPSSQAILPATEGSSASITMS